MTVVRVLLPVKRLEKAKSRLELAPPARRSIARALFQRTAIAASSCVDPDCVSVVTADPMVRAMAQQLGIGVLHDRHENLNGALSAALEHVTALWRTDTQVVLVSDLPRVTSDNLAPVIQLIADSGPVPRHVADLSRSGTTAVSIPVPTHVPMVFGPESAARFRALGCVPIHDAAIGIRADLDTVDDLLAFGTSELTSTATNRT